MKGIRTALLATSALVAVAIATPASAQFGCGIGAGASLINGNLYSGPLAPIGISVQGQKVDPELYCGYRMGAFVLGAGGSYGHYWGDVKDLGLKSDWTAYGFLGVPMAGDAHMPYVHVGYTEIRASGLKADGIKFGVGDRFKLSGPFSADMRYSYTQFDPDDFGLAGSGLKVNAHEFRLGLNLEFWTDGRAAAAKPLK